MKPLRLAGLVVVALVLACGQSLVTGDAQRGATLFKTQNCVMCHSVNGQGGSSAPDLGRIIGRDYAPALLAGLMWNHAPLMWTAMEKQGIARPAVTEQQAADLFAYFYATRYFDKPGDAGRGKQVLASKHCAECHASAGPGKPVGSWESAGDPVLLAERMWDHGAEMRAAFQTKGIKWPALTSQDLTDLLVYVQNLPENKDRTPGPTPAPSGEGQALFKEKGCIGCHQGKLSLDNRYLGRTLTDFAVAMWNHEPKMKNPPPALNGEEMRAIVAYLQTTHLFSAKANATRGKKVYTDKKCASCHDDAASGAPNLADLKGKFYPFFMVAALWEHGPAMQQKMRQKGIPWPRFKVPDMADLLAYLNSK
jgi:mono/diheme cytochrome c family protein